MQTDLLFGETFRIITQRFKDSELLLIAMRLVNDISNLGFSVAGFEDDDEDSLPDEACGL